MELAAQARLADLGEMAGPLAHELNNLLNSVLLHVAVLENSVPESARPKLIDIRRQGLEAAAMIRQFQRFREDEITNARAVDLNDVVRQTVGDMIRDDDQAKDVAGVRLLSPTQFGSVDSPIHSAVSMVLRLAPELPSVTGSVIDLKRLCRLLVDNAAVAIAQSGGLITISTEMIADKVRLRVEDTGPRMPNQLLGKLFEPGRACREGTSSLALAACQAIVRRLQGTSSAESGRESGLTMNVLLPIRPVSPSSAT